MARNADTLSRRLRNGCVYSRRNTLILLHEEHEITASDGKIKELLAFPYKWFHLDVENQGPDEVKVMVNAQSLPNATTLPELRGREYDAKHPKYWRVGLYAEAGKTATVKITTTR